MSTPTIADQLAVLRRVVARHIADGYTSGVPAAELLARSLETEIEAAGLRLDAEIRAARRAVVTRSLRNRPS